ncbi:hypothetical protein [Saccharothrix xinjiangensis]|uniref:Uncharacterized protein n=1 Tax=Saccharothrix xinjiangensis TaxID=204798 RepID=A0ABV9Y4Z2_9PSEU
MALKNIAASAGLRQKMIPEQLRDRLRTATQQAADVLNHTLKRVRNPDGHTEHGQHELPLRTTLIHVAGPK